MRKPNTAEPLETARAAWEAGEAYPNGDTWRTLSCRLVTPLYGGGVRAGEVDEVMPIRPSGIRGQLRFWWRLLYGANRQPAEVFAAETAIWGGIAHTGPTASKVAVRVDNVMRLHIAPAFVYKPNHKKPGEFRTMPEVAAWADGYALFPAQGKLTPDKCREEIPPHRLALADLGFSLHLRLHPDLTMTERQEIEATLRWWASFGGVGARTRRGLGAVKVEGLATVTETEVAERGGRLLRRAPVSNPETAWKESVGRLKDFRQKLDVGRNTPAAGSQSPAGRSRWPEADTLRELCGYAFPKHQKREVPGQVFPRAAFGLPIVFHFKDAAGKHDRQKKGFDPDDHTLEPADQSAQESRDRMASPLILRPYWNGQQWQPAALLLPGWQQALGAPLKFKEQHYTPAPWPTDPNKARNLADQIKPMQGRGTDPLTAFMDYFEKG